MICGVCGKVRAYLPAAIRERLAALEARTQAIAPPNASAAPIASPEAPPASSTLVEALPAVGAGEGAPPAIAVRYAPLHFGSRRP
jgi:hypothetical protein